MFINYSPKSNRGRYMSNQRKTIKAADERILFAEVEGCCPLCGIPLQIKKSGKTHKIYEIAHIYPLNPTPQESVILENETQLSSDVNNIKNLILLCPSCHEKFDKERTVEEYRSVIALKEKLIKTTKMRDTYHQFNLEIDINHIISTLYSGLSGDTNQLEYSALRIDEKMNESMPPIVRRKIRNNVTDYFIFIREKFSELDKNQPGKFDLIATQVKLFYIKTRMETENQEEIFAQMTEWMHIKTGKYSSEASEAVISFFVQNCEVFS
jgi:5-methylcytosine-specific restriction endonuclease McrA